MIIKPGVLPMGLSVVFSLLLLLMVTTGSARLCPDPVCPQDEAGNETMLLPSSNCKNFYSCVWGFPTLLACPPGLRFSEFIPGCVPEEMAECGPCEDPPQEQVAAEGEEILETTVQPPQPPPEDNVLQFINYIPFLYT